MLLREASVAGSMVATFAHHDSRIMPPFMVSTLHKVGHCLAQHIALGCSSNLLGAIEGAPGKVATNSNSGSTGAVIVSKVLAGMIVGGNVGGVNSG